MKETKLLVSDDTALIGKALSALVNTLYGEGYTGSTMVLNNLFISGVYTAGLFCPASEQEGTSLISEVVNEIIEKGFSFAITRGTQEHGIYDRGDALFSFNKGAVTATIGLKAQMNLWQQIIDRIPQHPKIKLDYFISYPSKTLEEYYTRTAEEKNLEAKIKTAAEPFVERTK